MKFISIAVILLGGTITWLSSQPSGPVFNTQGYVNIGNQPIKVESVNSSGSPANTFITGGTNYTYFLNNMSTNVDVTFGGLTPSETTPLPVYSPSFCLTSTNILLGVTNASVATNCAWACTNEVFRVAGGSGIIQNITLINATNREFALWIFDKVITAPTPGSAWTPTIEDLQFCIGKIDTSLEGSWTYAGTNWVKNIRNLAIACQNKDASKNVHIIGTYADSNKSNYTTSAYIKVGSISN